MYKTGNENDYSFLLELDEFGNSDFRDVNAIKKVNRCCRLITNLLQLKKRQKRFNITRPL